MKEYKYLKIEFKGKICFLKINNPSKLNAIDSMLLSELNDFFSNIEENNQINVIIISGEGRAFVAGADISEMINMNVEQAKKFGERGVAVFRKIEVSKKIIIASIKGYALGGGLELAMSCDLRISTPKAKLGQPEINLGIISGFSGTQRLARLVGISKAKEMFLLGENITGEEAYKIGLVNYLVEDENLMEFTFEIARKISQKSSTAMSFVKEAINRGIETDIETALHIETNLFAMCFATENQKEGMNAFLAKRTPVFK